MPTQVLLIRWTDAAHEDFTVRNLKKVQSDLDVLLGQSGATLVGELNWTLGGVDGVAVADGLEPADAALIAMALYRNHGVSVETLTAFKTAEIEDVLTGKRGPFAGLADPTPA